MNRVLPRCVKLCCGVGIVSLVGAGGAMGQPVEGVWATPTLDRWVYPFGDFQGNRTEASVFGAIGNVGFDDRDGQMLVGYDTAGQVPGGRGAGQYRVLAARLTVRISQSSTFVYDPTFDALATYLPAEHPDAAPDADAGRPIEVFPVGYRNGFSVATFQENSPFGGTPIVPPAEGARNAFVAVFDEQGEAVDASRHVRLEFEVRPLGVGRTTAVEPGAAVPQNADFTFDLDTSYRAGMDYLARGLDGGRVNLMVSSLHEVQQGVATSPIIYTKENPLGVPAKLELTVCVGPRVDWDCSGQVQPADVAAFIAAWFGDLTNGTASAADFDGNGAVEPADVAAFVGAWFAAL